MIGVIIVLINFTYCNSHRTEVFYVINICILYSLYSKQTTFVPGYEDTVSVIVSTAYIFAHTMLPEINTGSFGSLVLSALYVGLDTPNIEFTKVYQTI